MLEHCDVSNHTAAVAGTVVILIETAIGCGTATGTGFGSDVGTSMGIGIGGACAFYLTRAFAIANGYKTFPLQRSIANACCFCDDPMLQISFRRLVANG